MARPGEEITNPGTGEHLRFRVTGADSGGARLEFDLVLAPGGRVAGVPHRHAPAERFTVHAGRLSWRVGRAHGDAGPGETIDVPPGATHLLFNDTDEEVRAGVEVRPARDFETFFETVFALGQARRFRAFRGLPAPLHFALLADTYGVYGPLLPIAVQRPLMRALAAVARRRGYPVRLAPRGGGIGAAGGGAG